MQIVKNGVVLRTIDDWKLHAPPRTPDQWLRGRGAFECASAWFSMDEPAVPAEIQALLASNDDTASARIVTATPEQRVRFDRIRGEPRNTNVLAVAECPKGRIAIGIEVKADEQSDRTVEQVLADVVDQRAHGERTRMLTRVEQLTAALFPRWRRGVPRLGALRYQHLTAAAGALAHAREAGAVRAVLVVHEFVSARADDRRHAASYADLSAFVARLTDGAHASVEPGVLIGPLEVPGAPLYERPVPLYVGKAVRTLRPAV